MHVRLAAPREGLPEVGGRLFEIVEERVPSLPPRPAEGDHVQQVVLTDAHRDEGLDDLGEHLDVAAVHANVDVDDHPAVLEGMLQPRDLLLEGALDPDQRVVDPGVRPVDREGDLTQPGVHAAGQKLAVPEHPPVGHRLDLRISREASELDEVDVAGVDRRLAAREDQARRALAAPVEDLRLDLVRVPHLAIVGVRVEAEDAAVVALVGEADPVALVVGGGLVGFEPPVLHTFFSCLFGEHST